MESKRIKVSSLALRWILAISLTASPLLAGQSPQAGVTVAEHPPVVQVLDENNNPVVGSSILTAVLMDSPAQNNTDRTATELGAPEPGRNPNPKRAEPGGRTWSSLLIAALIAGGVVALILLLRGGDDKAPVAGAPGPHTVTPPPPETGTILAPGTPTVSAPH